MIDASVLDPEVLAQLQTLKIGHMTLDQLNLFIANLRKLA